jgi:hypothetical protein
MLPQVLGGRLVTVAAGGKGLAASSHRSIRPTQFGSGGRADPRAQRNGSSGRPPTFAGPSRDSRRLEIRDLLKVKHVRCTDRSTVGPTR